MSEKFNPVEYRKWEDLPEEKKELFVPLGSAGPREVFDEGFVAKSAFLISRENQIYATVDSSDSLEDEAREFDKLINEIPDKKIKSGLINHISKLSCEILDEPKKEMVNKYINPAECLTDNQLERFCNDKMLSEEERIVSQHKDLCRGECAIRIRNYVFRHRGWR